VAAPGAVCMTQENHNPPTNSQAAPDIVILTGLSGSGMSSATNAFEDLGYFCVDNLPITMLPTFARLVNAKTDDKGIERAALVIDIREGTFLHDFDKQLEALRAGSSGDGWLDELAPAERSRLIRVDSTGNRVALRHPLIGAAAVELATSGERRWAHAVLAELRAGDPECQAWHLAEAVLRPDEPTAALLEVAAHRALHQGDAVRAVHALLRAADLSPEGAGRARRLAKAAYVGAEAAGRLHSMPRLLGEARRADPDAAEPLEVTVATAYHLLIGERDVATAHLMLVRAIRTALDEGPDAHAVEEALHTLMVVCHFSGRADSWHAFESALSQLGATPPMLSVSLSSYGAPACATAKVLDELEALVATLPSEVDPVRIVRIALAAFYVDRLPACRPALWRVVRDGRDGGAATSAVNALMMLCHDAYLDGRWQEAARIAEEGIAWSERLGYELIALSGTYALAMLAAARGDEPATRSLTEQLRSRAAPHGLTMVEHFASQARGLAALGLGFGFQPGHCAPQYSLAGGADRRRVVPTKGLASGRPILLPRTRPARRRGAGVLPSGGVRGARAVGP